MHSQNAIYNNGNNYDTLWGQYKVFCPRLTKYAPGSVMSLCCVSLTAEKQSTDSGNYVGKFSLLNRSDSGDDDDDDDVDDDDDYDYDYYNEVGFHCNTCAL